MTRRHESLIPLTHDHHHALAQARRLKAAANDDVRKLLGQCQVFLDFFESDTVNHFREEEEVLFPLAVRDERAVPLLRRVMMEHLEIHALVAALATQVTEGNPASQNAIELAGALETHIRFEEGHLFPLLEEVIDEEQLRAIPLRDRERSDARA